jgi:hypothetical protein
MSLVACPDCSRHIRTTEVTCPFCSAAVAAAIASAAPRPIPSERLSRAAMVAFTAASLGAAACSGTVTSTGSGVQPHRDGATDGAQMTGTGGGNLNTGGDMPIVFYGAPFPPGGSSNAGGTSAGAGGTSNTGTGGASTSTGGRTILPLYGGPPRP